MTDFQAAMGVAQLERYADYLSTRQRLAQIFQSMINDIEWIQAIASEPMNTWNVQTFSLK